MAASWRIWSMHSKEMLSRDAAHIDDYLLKILTPVPDVSTVIYLLPVRTAPIIKSYHACEELESKAKCSRSGGYFSYVKNTHVCYI